MNTLIIAFIPQKNLQYLNKNLECTHMKNKFVTVAAIQSSVSTDMNENLIKTAKLVEQAAEKGAKIICLQELYRSIYFPQYRNEQR